ncbi:class I SAM-dependent methyltransferase [Halobacillus massiliensis]|uniref:class I SAM-dependent methyltransferase n=1 Tax=Halobacillus massiliensis TaxID=1926286 RepID=UPI0009E1E3CA|nr:class I SAM-dependent methyltransferase [Halobacillus massiliensis]
MKTTDFSKVAQVYDRNPFRFEKLEMDMDVRNFINNHPKSTYKLLDLACGTGIYLQHQLSSFKNYNMDWYGLDASQDMLDKAKEKLEDVVFNHGRAENMPYEDETFDIITNYYAFHHFTEKEKVLDDIHRVLKKNGVYKLHNINIYGMKNWWLYHYFPAALLEDYKRFWTHEVIFRELSLRGFEVKTECIYQMEHIKAADYIGHIENRDISVLTLIADEEYNQGFNRMKYDLKRNPEHKILNDFSEMVCIAEKK